MEGQRGFLGADTRVFGMECGFHREGKDSMLQRGKEKIRHLYRWLREESPVPRLAFYIGLTVELFMVIVDKSNYINPIEGYLFRLTFLLFACKLALTRYELRPVKGFP